MTEARFPEFMSEGSQDTECEEYSVEKKHKGIKKKNQGGRGCGKTVVGKLVPRQDCK